MVAAFRYVYQSHSFKTCLKILNFLLFENRVDGSYLCPDCGLPLCGDECHRNKKYHARECEVFANTPTGHKHKVKFGREK